MFSVLPPLTVIPCEAVSVLPSQRIRCTVPLTVMRLLTVTLLFTEYHVSVLSAPSVVVLPVTKVGLFASIYTNVCVAVW